MAFGTQTVTLFPSAALTATANGNAVNTATGNRPITGVVDGVAKAATILIDVTAASGTTPTLDISIQGRADSASNWITLAPLTGMSSAAFTQITAATTQTRRIEGPLPRQLRAVATIGGTTPSFTFSVKAVLGG